MAGEAPEPRIAVTGATGRLGGRVADRLAGRGTAQRLVVRDRTRAPDLTGASVVEAQYDDAEACRRALGGVDTVLMVSAAEHVERVSQHKAFVDAAAAAGVRHLVYTSFYGAAPDCTFTLGRDHWATEEHIRASGLRWTFLRDNFYLELLPDLVGDDGHIRGPAGEGRVAAVALDDVADVAVAVLLDPAAHREVAHRLTGPESLSFAEVARRMSARGRPVTYQDETLEEAYRSRAHYGAAPWLVDAWVSTYSAIAAGELAEITDNVPRITGHEAVGLNDLLAATG